MANALLYYLIVINILTFAVYLLTVAEGQCMGQVRCRACRSR